ncbi:integrase core domain-containing protein [Flaviflexus massiliensis]|uniref:integrase core domain-containing protein n=1 Tax=Flaviflexus massiliensis TaxID=1522309 RepID=UPI000AF3B018
MKYEWLFREEIDDGLQLVEHVNAYRRDYNHVRPHEAIAWNRPADVYAGTANPTIPNFETKKSCQLLDAGHDHAPGAVLHHQQGRPPRPQPAR